MNEVYTVGDLHLGHNNILDFAVETRPYMCIKEHDDDMIERINTNVKKNDTLVLVGDIAFSVNALKRIQEIRCINKVLVLGNHDNLKMDEYAKYFNRVVAHYRHREFLFTHMPVLRDPYEGWKINVHGHQHKYQENFKYNVNVCYDVLYQRRPITITEIREMLKNVISD